MSLPRNVLAKKMNINRKRENVKKINQQILNLETICKKHRVGDLTFRTCKFASLEGNITFIDHKEIKGNMRSGIMLVKSLNTYVSSEVYDLVQIKRDKIKRDAEKKIQELEKAKLELERIEAQNKENNSGEESSIEKNHEELVDVLLNPGDDLQDKHNNDNSQDKSNNEESQDKPNNDDSQDKSSNEDSQENKSNNKQKNNNQKRSKKKERNKYYRNFMSDIKSKFVLKLQPDFNFFEVKHETTDMVITDSIVYEIIISQNIKEKYYLVIGDLQMKSGIIRRIDPAYKFDNVLKEQSDFLERIKAKEQIKITEYPEDLDLDSSDCSDNESDTETNT
ncbi:hypothetical protein [Saudi moumouvirus]|nr:hypothetical protein [Saudi moumouvirus]